MPASSSSFPYSEDSKLSTKDWLRLGQQGVLSPAALDQALIYTGKRPNLAAWLRWAQYLCLGFGAAGVLLGIIFAVAYNWEAINILLGHWGKFAALEAGAFGVLGLAVWQGLDSRVGRVCLISSMVLIGPLLALFGQTYQTGADTFTLFLTWAGLVLPWAVASRHGPTWLLVMVLFETALLAYFDSFGGFFGLVWRAFWGGFTPWLLIVLSNFVVLILWEFATYIAQQLSKVSPYQIALNWLLTDTKRLVPRIAAWILVAVLTLVCDISLFERHINDIPSGFSWLLWLIIMIVGGWFYIKIKQDIFMVLGGLIAILSLILTLEVYFFDKYTSYHGHGIHGDTWVLLFFIIAITLLWFSTAARSWLRTL